MTGNANSPSTDGCYRRFVEQGGELPTKVPPLETLYFYLTKGCNLACKHCWLAPEYDKDGSKYPVLDVDLFQKIIEEALPLGLTSVKLTGGEPLLHPEILKILNIIKRECLDLRIETNGLLCTDDIALKISEFEKSFVSVSLDGATAEVHDRIRGVAGAFDQAVAGIKRLLKNSVDTQIIFSLMAENVHQYKDIITVAENLGVHSLKFNIIHPTGKGLTQYKMSTNIPIEQYVQIGKEIENRISKKTSIHLFYDHPPAFRPLSKLADARGGGTCGIRQILGVLASGMYALCGIGTTVEEMSFVKAGKDSLKQVWYEYAILEKIRNDLPGNFTGVCGRCLMKEMCLGSCIAQNYFRTASIVSSFWYCDVAEKHGLFPVIRLLPS
jgi:SynChlorMet cassette radical SAM/SPASM protein ScmF